MADAQLSRGQLLRLLELGRALVSELDLEALLHRLVSAARDLTGARYAALGVLGAERKGLERFFYVGIDEDTRRRIGELPRGRGVLGELIENPVPLRLDDVSAHPRSYGFPAHHPPMRTFLGLPVMIRGEAWGNLYLTEKAGGQPFTETDERLCVVLTEWAAVAIENARLYQDTASRRAELERVVGGLEASAVLARAVASGMDASRLGELAAKRARDLVDAETVALLLPAEEGLTVVAAAGARARGLVGSVASSEERIVADALESANPRRFAAEHAERLDPGGIGVEARHVLAAALDFRDGPRGLILAFDRVGPGPFGTDEERLFGSIAGSIATTISTARAAEAERTRLGIAASERERARWARELHDETLQELGALRVMLEAVRAGGSADEARAREMLDRAVEHVTRGIANLQGIITELRPAALDTLGIEAALETLADRLDVQSDVELSLTVELSQGDGAKRLAPELEATIYRVVQESLNNVIKHAGATRATAQVRERGRRVEIDVTDDGRGFDASRTADGFGLVAMRERVDLAKGEITVNSKPGRGTSVHVELPLAHAGESPAPRD